MATREENNNKTIIEARNLSRVYGKKAAAFTALNEVDLHINQGESVAVIGKSGSGKSTLMHLIALLDRPSHGKVFIHGKDATKLDNKELGLQRNQEFGFVFQQFFLNSSDTVLNNVILPLKIAGISRSERNRRGLDALEMVELKDKANNKANDLSGGQKQRVAIARALINNPSVILADEPTGNLDTATGEVIENILFSLNRDKGITLIIVTHDPDLAEKCDRQIVLKDGKIVGKA